MPRRMTQTKAEAHQTMKNVSFESQAVTWLMQDGWQVFLPLLDYGHKTDILISDGPNYYRVQVKTVEATGEDHEIFNLGMTIMQIVLFGLRETRLGVMLAKVLMSPKES